MLDLYVLPHHSRLVIGFNREGRGNMLKKEIRKAIQSLKKIPQRKWYSITCKDDIDGVGPESMRIISVAQQMHIKCGWFQGQGLRVYGVHCTPHEINQLINELGRDTYSYSVMSSYGIRLLKKNIWAPF